MTLTFLEEAAGASSALRFLLGSSTFLTSSSESESDESESEESCDEMLVYALERLNSVS